MPTSEYSDRLDPVLDFLRLLWSIEHGLQRASKRMSAEIGITGPQRLVLRVVERFPGISAGELAHVLRLHPSTITGILQRLVARGMLRRDRDANDTRRTRLRITARGGGYVGPLPGTVERAVSRALSRSGPAHLRSARRVLTELASQLEVG